MRSLPWIIVTLGFVVLTILYFLPKIPHVSPTSPTSKTLNQRASPMTFSITSPAFVMNGNIPKRFTCDGENISPEFLINGVPEGTQSLALTMEDPDVPTSIRADGMWDHWIIWNMPPSTTHIVEGAMPPGILGTGTSGKAAYFGPCPPDREHRYIFTLYALDATITLPKGSSKNELLQAMNSHIIGQTNLIGKYDRK